MNTRQRNNAEVLCPESSNNCPAIADQPVDLPNRNCFQLRFHIQTYPHRIFLNLLIVTEQQTLQIQINFSGKEILNKTIHFSIQSYFLEPYC